MQRFVPLVLALFLTGCANFLEPSSSNSNDADVAFDQLAKEYIAGYLAWRPQTGTALGLHEYDGKVTDFSRASLDNELRRLKSFEFRLLTLNANMLSKRSAYDASILRSAIQREIFGFEQMQVHS